uniref:Uncharacterized protein n=1 Tax=Ananas comosus var. bracteatus TaxID=296719 RepID=A0A6V7QS43_ANACO
MGDNHDQAESREPIGEDETLKATLKELAETREEIRRAREEAVQAWLDSMPLVNKLEKLQSNLSRTTNKLELVNIAVASLESLLESTDRSIKYKQEEEAKSKVSIEEMRKEVDRARMEPKKRLQGSTTRYVGGLRKRPRRRIGESRHLRSEEGGGGEQSEGFGTI